MALAYPVGSDLEAWIGGTVSTELAAFSADIVTEVTDTLMLHIPTGLLAAAARPDGASPDCPTGLFRGIVMRAGKVAGRRATREGWTSAGDIAVRVDRYSDGDIDFFTNPFTVAPEA